MKGTRLPFRILSILLLAGCASGDPAPSKPPRLHAPPLTPDLVASRGERQSEYYERQALLVNEWIRRTGLPPRQSAGLSEVVQQSRDQKGKYRSLNPIDLVTDLKSWFQGAQARDTVQRAAAYLVADRVLRLAWRPFLLTDRDQWQEQRDTLRVLGAETFYSDAASEVVYSGSWLKHAMELDPAGPMGQRAKLLLAETDCAGGESADAYHAIIMRIDSVLTTAADSQVRFTAAVLEADAYRDMVALAHGFGRENADSTKFAPEADAAKQKALQLYEGALVVDSTSRLARGARLAHDRLASGQPLDHVRFFCFAD